MKAKKAERSPLLTRLAKHGYAADGIPDVQGDDRCGECGLPRSHQVHELEPTDTAVSEVEQRRIGEGEGK